MYTAATSRPARKFSAASVSPLMRSDDLIAQFVAFFREDPCGPAPRALASAYRGKALLALWLATLRFSGAEGCYRFASFWTAHRVVTPPTNGIGSEGQPPLPCKRVSQRNAAHRKCSVQTTVNRTLHEPRSSAHAERSAGLSTHRICAAKRICPRRDKLGKGHPGDVPSRHRSSWAERSVVKSHDPTHIGGIPGHACGIKERKREGEKERERGHRSD